MYLSCNINIAYTLVYFMFPLETENPLVPISTFSNINACPNPNPLNKKVCIVLSVSNGLWIFE